MTRLALLTEIPAPYRIPLFNALAAHEAVDPTVLYLRERNPERPYRLHEDELRFRSAVLPGADVTIRGRWLVLNRGVVQALRAARPDVVVLGGWNQPAFWTALAWAARRRLPVVFWVESTPADARPATTLWPKRLLAPRAAGFVVPGRASADYVAALAPGARVAIAPNAVDAELFASRTGERAALRRELGLERPCVLCVGRLAPEKGADVLVEAARGLDAEVILAGSGPEEAALRAAAPANVRLVGHLERDELPRFYAAADVLCVPSRSEPWGMALNEGAAAGLPLVATTAAGGAWDLIEEGANGFRVPPDDAGALRSALARLVADPELRAAAGARSRELAAAFTPERWADAVASLARTVAG